MKVKKHPGGKNESHHCPVLLILAVIFMMQINVLQATPSTQIWNPSTDIQKAGTLHFGVDNYFSLLQNSKKPFQLYPDMGLTYGFYDYLEVGVDMIQPSADPFYFNFKAGLPESEWFPAIALGGFNFGTKSDVSDYKMLYGLLAKTFPALGRFSAGYYRGLNGDLFKDETGKKANDGLILSWDKLLTDKIWASLDYASGNSWYGGMSFGFSYAFSENVSVIFGYVIFNNQNIVPNNTFTTQLDINLF